MALIIDRQELYGALDEILNEHVKDPETMEQISSDIVNTLVELGVKFTDYEARSIDDPELEDEDEDGPSELEFSELETSDNEDE